MSPRPEGLAVREMAVQQRGTHLWWWYFKDCKREPVVAWWLLSTQRMPFWMYLKISLNFACRFHLQMLSQHSLKPLKLLPILTQSYTLQQDLVFLVVQVRYWFFVLELSWCLQCLRCSWVVCHYLLTLSNTVFVFWISFTWKVSFIFIWTEKLLSADL